MSYSILFCKTGKIQKWIEKSYRKQNTRFLGDEKEKHCTHSTVDKDMHKNTLRNLFIFCFFLSTKNEKLCILFFLSISFPFHLSKTRFMYSHMYLVLSRSAVTLAFFSRACSLCLQSNFYLNASSLTFYPCHIIFLKSLRRAVTDERRSSVVETTWQSRKNAGKSNE